MKFPIYDRIIAMIVFGRLVENKKKHYIEYTEALEELANEKNMPANVIERSIFNWSDTPGGNQWREIRNRVYETSKKSIKKANSD